jgi:hypothetical protein
MKTHATKFRLHAHTLKDVRNRVSNSVKSGTNTEKFRPNTEFRKYGRKNTHPVFISILETSVPHFVPFQDFLRIRKRSGQT